MKRLSNTDQNSRALTNVPTPSAGGDAANKTYVDTKKTDSVSTNNRLLGRATAGAGAIEEITIGTGLSLSGTTLNATGGGTGDVTGPASSASGNIATFNGTTGKTIQDSGKSTPSGAIVGTTDTQTFTNKTLDASTVLFADTTDATKKAQFQLSGFTTGVTRIFTLPNFNGTLATVAGTETLTNKTLTTPTLSGTVSGTTAGRLGYSSGALSFGDGSVQRLVVTTDNTQTLTNKTFTSPIISTISNTGTLTLPTSTDTIVGRATTDTLTNKDITDTTNTVPFRRVVHGATATTARPNATFVEWIGSVAPTNANTTNDTWIDTA